MSAKIDCVARLCDTVRSLRLLAPGLDQPLRLALLPSVGNAAPLASADLAAAEALVAAAFERIGIEDLRFCHGAQQQLTSFELLISRRVSAAFEHGLQGAGDLRTLDEARRLIASQALAFDNDPSHILPTPIPLAAGLSLAAYASPKRHSTAMSQSVMMVLPCGMPFDLCLPWFESLGQEHFVVTWETRGLFGECVDFDALDCAADAQINDLFAVLDHFGIKEAHLMGICGGAMIALAAAARRPEQIKALSLWYGDFVLADSTLRTDHQQNFEWLMSEAAQGREDAADLHGMFLDQKLLSTVPEAIAHHALLPYANQEAFYRYAKLNHALNQLDVEPLLASIDTPTLVVAGQNDTTTHTGGSAFIARALRNASLRMEAHGDHQSFFSAPDHSKTMAVEFIDAAVAVPA